TVDALVIAGQEGEQIFTLKGADHRYRQLVETMNEGAATVSADGVIAYCNLRFAEMLCRPHENVVGASLFEMVAPGSQDTAAALVRRAAGGTARAELEMLTENGTVIPVYLSGTPNAAEEAAGICLIVTDLTEQKKNEELVAAERLAGSIIDQAAEALVVCDAEGRVIRSSQACHRLLRRNPVMELFTDAVPLRGVPSDGPGLPVMVARALRGESWAGVEMALDRAGAEPATLLVSIAPLLKAGGQVNGCVISLIDISARRHAESRLEELATSERRAREAAEAATRAKDEFLATVSHELRTPLSAIVGWTRLLRVGRLTGDKQEHALSTIERNAKAQAQLIEDLLDVSRIISGKLRLKIERLDLGTVVQNAVDSVQPSADAKGVQLSVELDRAAGIVMGDPDRMVQVVWNLLANAVKFTAKGGRIDVRLRRSGSDAEIAVEDTGAGIDPQFLPYVFDRFRQGDPSGSRATGGLGLGLAIVRHLAEQHGGRVTAYSDGKGRGSRFIIRMPVAGESAADEAGATPVPRTRSASARLEGTKVLVIDDDADSRELVIQILTDAGARVLAADSTAQGLALARAQRPDVLLSDIGLPGDDGLSLIRQLRCLPGAEGGLTPAVALTGYSRAQDRTEALMAGFDMHLSKPADPGELVSVVAKLATRPAGMDGAVAPGRRRPARRYPPATVLVIDDAKDVREMMAEILEDAGYRVATACHGADGLARLRSGLNPQVILLDLMMPIMNGWQFREEQRQDSALAPIPVVVVSANGAAKALAIDAAAVISKPIDVDKLLDTVGLCVDGAPGAN
ncbi:MAG TPA: response regulator, partial [Polyangia bacterium]|nr:response regulator [Polyangia bacterium]